VAKGSAGAQQPKGEVEARLAPPGGGGQFWQPNVAGEGGFHSAADTPMAKLQAVTAPGWSGPRPLGLKSEKTCGLPRLNERSARLGFESGINRRHAHPSVRPVLEIDSARGLKETTAERVSSAPLNSMETGVQVAASADSPL